VTAVALAFRAQLRVRWRSWIAIALLIGLIGGVVLGLVAAGRRTNSAFPRLLSTTASADALVYSASAFGLPPVALTHLPQVSRSGAEAFPQAELVFAGRVLSSDWQLAAPASASFGKTIERGKLLEGRWANPDALGQAVVSYDPPDGVRLGSVMRLEFYTPGQAGELFDAFGPIPNPQGPSRVVRVVGISASSASFPSGGEPSPTLYVTRALLQEVSKKAAVAYAYAVRLRAGAGEISSFASAVAELRGGADLYVDGLGGNYNNIERSIHLQAVLWWILAAIAGVAGLIVIAQILARRAAVDSEEFPIFRAIGMTRRELFALGFISAGGITLGGVLLAVAVAFALSPLTPIGEAGIAEPHPGVFFDTVALGLGALAILLAVQLAGVVPALLAARRGTLEPDSSSARPARRSLVALRLARAGASASAVVGTRLAFERGRGRSAVPAFSGSCGAILAVIALVGTTVFASSLAHLLDSPRLYGSTFDLQIQNPGGTVTSIVPALLGYSDISQLSLGIEQEVMIRGTEIDTIAEESEKGPLLTPPVISGHAVAGPFQIVLGESTLRRVRGEIGEDIPVSIGHRTMRFKVVGTAAFPVFGNAGGLGTGANMSLFSYDRLAGCTKNDTSTICILDGAVVNLRPGPGRASTMAKLESAYGNGASVPVVPSALVNFGQSSDLPLVFGLAVALFGAATLLHFLLVSVTRRRRDTGVLKTLGLLGRQVRAIVLFQARAVVVVAIIVGLPLGIAAGRLAWNITASGFGVISEVVVPIWPLVAIALGSLAVGNLLALVPGEMSSRLPTASALRAL
jgi:ABC-type lipoprotein release transport system permease subunit